MRLLFLDSNTVKVSSRKDHERRDAVARSHAATIAHRRAKTQARAQLASYHATLSPIHYTFTEPIDPQAFIAIESALRGSLKQSTLYCGGDTVTGDAVGDPDAKPNQRLPETASLLHSHSVLLRGQSDPFDTFPVRIDARTHDFIMYFRDSVLLRRYRLDSKTWTRSQTATADWQDATRSLEDQGLGNAFLAQLSANSALESPSKERIELSLEYVRRSTATLRRRLESKEEDWDSPKVWRHMSLLQNAEMLIRNREAAVIHGKALRRHFDSFVARGKTLDMRLLLHALYVDLHTAIIFLVRPNFEPSLKLLAEFPEIKDTLLRDVSTISRPRSRRCLDNQILSEPLRNFFLRWEQYHAITFFFGRRLWTFITQLQVVNYFLDVEGSLNRKLNSSDTTFFYVQEAYISLAALYFIRITTLPEHFETKPLFSAHTALLRRLRYYLEISDPWEDDLVYSRARLWALFIGALSEQNAALLNRSHPASASEGWFNTQLAQQVKRCQIVNWAAFREILEDFMYVDVVPDPADWCGAYCSQR